MSVTFLVADAPTKTMCCQWCAEVRSTPKADREFARAALDGAWVEDPEALSEEDWSRVQCDPWCRGTETVWPEGCEANFANTNAAGILRLLDLPCEDGLCGSIEADEIPAVLQRILVVMNRRGARAPLDRDAADFRAPARVVTDPETGLDRIATGPRVVSFGNTDADTMRRLDDLRTLFVKAREHGSSVTWA